MTVTGSASGTETAQKTWELLNNVSTEDKIYSYDREAQREISNRRPWRADPNYFKHVKISATALIKMVMHARSGGQYEIMGLMQGKIEENTFVVLDAFPLPVIGTETRVNAGSEADAFAVEYQTRSSEVGRNENIVGWYHSHPGYGCWLSGIDVSTQMTNQMFQDPFLAIVIDPNRTVSAGKVEIGAFRTYPDNYTPPNVAPSEYQSIPLNKIEDFGVHASRYYPLEISHFKSSLDTKLLDLLWNKYWVMTLSQSPLVSNRAYTTSQIADLTDKLSRTESSLTSRSGVAYLAPEVAALKNGGSSTSAANGKGKEKVAEVGEAAPKREETALGKAIRDSTKVSVECQCGLLSQSLKHAIFNLKSGGLPDAALPSAH